MKKTVIEVDTADHFIVDGLIRIIDGYLKKKGLEYTYLSYTEDEGKQLTILKAV